MSKVLSITLPGGVKVPLNGGPVDFTLSLVDPDTGDDLTEMSTTGSFAVSAPNGVPQSLSGVAPVLLNNGGLSDSAISLNALRAGSSVSPTGLSAGNLSARITDGVTTLTSQTITVVAAASTLTATEGNVTNIVDDGTTTTFDLSGHSTDAFNTSYSISSADLAADLPIWLATDISGDGSAGSPWVAVDLFIPNSDVVEYTREWIDGSDGSELARGASYVLAASATADTHIDYRVQAANAAGLSEQATSRVQNPPLLSDAEISALFTGTERGGYHDAAALPGGDGSSVAAWPGLSANETTLTTVSASVQPLLRKQNGLAWIEPDGIDDTFDAGRVLTGASQLSFAFSWETPSDVSINNQCEILGDRNSSGAFNGGLSIQFREYLKVSLKDGTQLTGQTPSKAAPNESQAVVVLIDYTAATDTDRIKIYVNGVQQTLTFSGALTGTAGAVADRDQHYFSAGAGLYSDGKFYSTLLIDRLLTPAEITGITNRFRFKNGTL